MSPSEITTDHPADAPTGVRIRLHPNLARLAASYQEICERFALGSIDAVQSSAEVRDLVARDDDGVQWTINPRDGGWLYMSMQNGWQPGTPPTSGLATLTAHDVTARSSLGSEIRYNPDDSIAWSEVDESAEGLRGATRRAEVRAREAAKPRSRGVVGAVAAGFLVLVVGSLVMRGSFEDSVDSGGGVATEVQERSLEGVPADGSTLEMGVVGGETRAIPAGAMPGAPGDS